jgi:hypothetical protein
MSRLYQLNDSKTTASNTWTSPLVVLGLGFDACKVVGAVLGNNRDRRVWLAMHCAQIAIPLHQRSDVFDSPARERVPRHVQVYKFGKVVLCERLAQQLDALVAKHAVGQQQPFDGLSL